MIFDAHDQCSVIQLLVFFYEEINFDSYAKGQPTAKILSSHEEVLLFIEL